MEVSRNLEWSERAILDYENLVEYLFFKWGESITLKVLSEIDYQISRVAKYPEQFPIVNKPNEIRRCVASPQTSIFFVVKPQSIYLLSIFDNRLDPDKHPG
ncbi:Plasmid stabilization system protein ParE [Dyadobacter psychrophilus]|uniref:Plasmid stabilization system protein ParE n=1 Tax=Dyadobacter psychrophilus TaxID=651661 RepID=A0A1T5FUQ2_9BACT|nr:Plasmid stabilization system protein ParE [Dyadobacter psychrophilus]